MFYFPGLGNDRLVAILLFSISVEKRLLVLKNFLTIPDIFELDERRRRQVLNMLLLWSIFLVVLALVPSVYSLYAIIKSVLSIKLSAYETRLLQSDGINIIRIIFIFLIIACPLFFINRSPKVPSWITGLIFILLIIFIIMLSDIPAELIVGRSQLVWVVPIMLGAIVLNPGSVFPIAFLLSILIVMIGPARPGADFSRLYLIIELFFIAFVSWLSMSIANRAVRDARNSAAKLEAIYNHVADGVLVLDTQGHFLSANPAFFKMIPKRDLPELLVQPLEKIVRWKRKFYSVSTSAVPEVGTVAVFRDDTRRHETERVRNALLATASHELRTPLTAVMNYLELMQVLARQDKVNTDGFNEHVARALENTKRLQSLVNDILDQAQIQAGVLNLKRETFNLNSLLERVHKLLEVLLKRKNLSYELAIAPEVPHEIVGDAGRLHQVLVNLLGNAIKFTNQGGVKVHVSAPCEERISIQVVDTGPGIPAEQLPDIFEAFRHGSDYTQRERQGAGLGLSIAKEIITHMGGEISVSSELGNGSIFTVLLPVEAA